MNNIDDLVGSASYWLEGVQATLMNTPTTPKNRPDILYALDCIGQAVKLLQKVTNDLHTLDRRSISVAELDPPVQ